MRVLHISTHDTKGGAALAAYRLHQALLRQGCDSTMLVRRKASKDPTVVTIQLSRRFTDRLLRIYQRWRVARGYTAYANPLSKVEIFSDDRGLWSDSIAANVEGFDVIQLHWVCGFLDYRRFFADTPQKIPLVWRLADMNAFTGGCSYDWGCGRFTNHCGSCPHLGAQAVEDLSRSIWNRKHDALKRLDSKRLHIVVLNRWMADQVRRSSLLGRFELSIIPNGVDLDDFHPIEPTVARRALGIPHDKKVVAFVAEAPKHRRKGFAVLVDALQGLASRPDLFLLVLGETGATPPPGLPFLHLGFVHHPALLSLAYSASHVFVIPSLEDNQPNTVLEAMACGTPVVGFKVGGIPEMVGDGETGLLAPRGDTPELAKAIASLLDSEKTRAAMGARGRERVEQSFSRDRQVKAYLNLYASLIQRQRTSGASTA